MRKIKIVLILLFIVSSFQFQAQALAEDIIVPTEGRAVPAGEWARIIESKFCTILCGPDVDIKELNRKIKIPSYDILLSEGRYLRENSSTEDQLAEKFDAIFQKVEQILDMYPRRIHLTVKIYKDQSQLDDSYVQLFGALDEKERISFYVHKYTTIYTTEQVIREGVLAHEMGHAVVDHYFLILPPEKIKELLSQVVEIHLRN